MNRLSEKLLNLIEALIEVRGKRTSFIDYGTLSSITFDVGWSSDMLINALKELEMNGYIKMEDSGFRIERNIVPIKPGL